MTWSTLGERTTCRPLGTYRVKLKGRGHKLPLVTSELRHLARLSRWLDERQLGAADLSNERLSLFCSEMPRRRDGGCVCSRRALTQVLEVFEDYGLEHVDAKGTPASPS
jgi:hypothetical protein